MITMSLFLMKQIKMFETETSVSQKTELKSAIGEIFETVTTVCILHHCIY